MAGFLVCLRVFRPSPLITTVPRLRHIGIGDRKLNWSVAGIARLTATIAVLLTCWIVADNQRTTYTGTFGVLPTSDDSLHNWLEQSDYTKIEIVRRNSTVTVTTMSNCFDGRFLHLPWEDLGYGQSSSLHTNIVVLASRIFVIPMIAAIAISLTSARCRRDLRRWCHFWSPPG
ncbi:membrane protein [Rhodopirellula sp. SWK7]|nr:membrane protein [Rhodopirellula sp. SWK7]